MAITLKDFRAFAQEKMSEGIANPDQFREKFKEILDFAVANETSMDAEANAYFDNLTNTIADMFEQGLSNAPDSPEKRRMLRAIAGTRRKHHRSQDFPRDLGGRSLFPSRSPRPRGQYFLRRISPF